jgi:hypothetical protein
VRSLVVKHPLLGFHAQLKLKPERLLEILIFLSLMISRTAQVSRAWENVFDIED